MHAGGSAAFAAILLLLIVFACGARFLRRARRLPGPAPAPARLAAAAEARAEAEPASLADATGTALEATDIAPPGEPTPGDPPPPAPSPPEAELCSQPPGETPRPPAPLAIWVERPLVRVTPPWRGKTRHPIVLAHGFAGFDAVAIPGLRLAYFRGVEERLRAAGIEVHVLRVSPLASVAKRAEQLAAQVRKLPAERFNIVAHSMGGLDARYAITALGLGDRVASLTTIGTPHRGTPLADLGVSLFGGALGRLGLPLLAVHDLTTARMALFNQESRDASGVVYGCFVASTRQVNAVLVPAHRLLHRLAGANDGIVPASSQRWGAVLGEIDADHWGAIGWSSRFDAGTFYERLALDLGARGL